MTILSLKSRNTVFFNLLLWISNFEKSTAPIYPKWLDTYPFYGMITGKARTNKVEALFRASFSVATLETISSN